MKVDPRHQTLLLASERRRSGDASVALYLQSIAAVRTGTGATRSSRVAPRGGDSLHRPADIPGPSGRRPEPPALRTIRSGTVAALEAGREAAVSTGLVSSSLAVRGNVGGARDVGLTAHLPPVEQYARSQQHAPGGVGGAMRVDLYA